MKKLIFCKRCGRFRGCVDKNGEIRYCYSKCEKRRGCEILFEFQSQKLAEFRRASEFEILFHCCLGCRKEMRRL